MPKKQTKYIFVTGGVLSGSGKGITAASIGNTLKSRGLNVNIQKCDQYLNVDAGTLNPARHGEVFVTKDGAETDLDLGHYERFMDVELTQGSSLMNGWLYKTIIDAERSGAYLGRDVQVVPHVTDLIQEQIKKTSEGYDVHIVEIGGTVGDIEGAAYIEAIREFGLQVGRANAMFVHVVYLPYLSTSGEYKTKPAQNAVRQLRSNGIYPDVIAARSEGMPTEDALLKLSSFTVEREAIVALPNAQTVYQVPLTLEQQGTAEFITKRLGLPAKKPNNKAWQATVDSALKKHPKTINVGMVAKYLENQDTYLSVFEALRAAAFKHKVNLNIDWIDAETITKRNVASKFKKVDGIVVPGGFGARGVEGKIEAAIHAINKQQPYLGLCLGMQVATVASARLAGLDGANTPEVDPNTPHPVVHVMADQEHILETGGTMRLGDYECVLEKGTTSYKLYGKKHILERHRHRYEFNNAYRDQLVKAGLVIAGQSPDGTLVEVVERKGHPFFVASQYHPEFKSRPNRPHPMFDGFISALKKAHA